MDIHPELTVLVAPNGAGKTTLLDAARIAVWPLVKAFDLASQTGKSATIQIEDVRKAKQAAGNQEAITPSEITATGFWKDTDKEYTWKQTRKRLKVRTNTLSDKNTKQLIQWGSQLQEQVRHNTDNVHSKQIPVNLPLVVYLGTGRLWYQGRYTSIAKHKKLNQGAYSRTWGYQNCITASSSYKQFEDWYSWIYRSYREQQIMNLEKGLSVDHQDKKKLPFKHIIDVVQQAVNQVVHRQQDGKTLLIVRVINSKLY
jgi:predicted ATP-binding protein involved in virulence